jgi:hypothetical protein
MNKFTINFINEIDYFKSSNNISRYDIRYFYSKDDEIEPIFLHFPWVNQKILKEKLFKSQQNDIPNVLLNKISVFCNKYSKVIKNIKYKNCNNNNIQLKKPNIFVLEYIFNVECKTTYIVDDCYEPKLKLNISIFNPCIVDISIDMDNIEDFNDLLILNSLFEFRLFTNIHEEFFVPTLDIEPYEVYIKQNIKYIGTSKVNIQEIITKFRIILNKFYNNHLDNISKIYSEKSLNRNTRIFQEFFDLFKDDKNFDKIKNNIYIYFIYYLICNCKSCIQLETNSIIDILKIN